VALAKIRDSCDNDTRAAIGELNQALRLAPGDANARSFLGIMRTQVGDYDAGLDDLRAALALDPRSYVAAVELARELLIVRRFDEAARVCDRARELAPGDVHALVLCALIPFWRHGDASDARRALALLPAELPSSGNGAWSLFQLLALFPDETVRLAAAGRLTEPFSSVPFIPRSYVVGCAHAARGEQQEARDHFAKALSALEPRAEGDALVRLFTARAYAGVGRADDALREGRRVLELATDPQRRASVLRFLAEIAAAAGRRDEAITALREVLSRRDGLVTAASVGADPRFAPLRGDARFDALVRMPVARRNDGAPFSP
jgi:tetratricopeptide (TPR) repeat protein